MVPSDHTDSFLMGLHHNLIRRTVGNAGDRHEASGYEFSFVERVVVEADFPPLVFFTLLFFGGGRFFVGLGFVECCWSC